MGELLRAVWLMRGKKNERTHNTRRLTYIKSTVAVIKMQYLGSKHVSILNAGLHGGEKTNYKVIEFN